ncbi:MAG: GNAT family N-acetyltransferase [Oscillochloridaceae bacterium umkhey_bin13]
MEIRAITAAETRRLRHLVLRPHQRPEELVYPGDDAPDSLHVGAFRGKQLVGVTTVVRRACPQFELPAPWQIEGVATLPEVRGLGYGQAMLDACVAHVAFEGGATLWCNGRTSAAGFYQARGFRPLGPEFVTATGPHFVFVCPLPEYR